MKNAMTISGTLLFCSLGFGQIVGVAVEKMNVLYKGIYNPLTISVESHSCKEIVVKTSNGVITGSNGKYNFMPKDSAGKSSETYLYVGIKSGSTVKWIDTLKFRVKRIPDPVPMIANISGGYISKAVLIAAACIIPTLQNFDFDLSFVITSYTMTMNVKGDLIEKNAVGNKLTADMFAMINAAATGTKIYFENIKAICPDGTPRSLSSINLKLI
jgi:hypothetical protein